MPSTKTIIVHVTIAAIFCASYVPIAALHGKELTDLSKLGSPHQRRGLHSAQLADIVAAASSNNNNDFQINLPQSPHSNDEDSTSTLLLPDAASATFRRHVIDRSLRYCYMDELFHVGQLLEYALLSNWSRWDPMITTPPGAYVPALVFVKATLGPVLRFVAEPRLHAYMSQSTARKDVALGRKQQPLQRDLAEEQSSYLVFVDFWAAWAVTLARAVGPLLYLMMTLVLQSSRRAPLLCTWAVCVGCAPLLFFSSLCYTDMPSAAALSCVLIAAERATYSTAKSSWQAFRRWMWVSAFGVVAITVRQTNLVWLGFAAGVYCLLPLTLDGASAPRSIAQLARTLTLRVFHVMPAALAAAACVAFVVFFNNGNIVLGDASNHRPAWHPAQLALFFATVAALTPLQSLMLMWKMLRWSTRSTIAGAVMAPACGIVFVGMQWLLLHHYQVHPYILADNRHLTFYVHRRVFQEHNSLWFIRKLVLPALATIGVLRISAAACPTDSMIKSIVGAPAGDSGKFVDRTEQKPRQSAVSNGAAASSATSESNPMLGTCIRVAWFLTCVIVACVPQALLEFRYFIAPMQVMGVALVASNERDVSLQRRGGRRAGADAEQGLTWAAIMDGLFAVAVHAAILFVFVQRPVAVDDSHVGIRLMW